MLALPLPELSVGGTSLEPFISALYLTLAANDVGPANSIIPADIVNARPARIIASRIVALRSNSPGMRRNNIGSGIVPAQRRVFRFASTARYSPPQETRRPAPLKPP